VVTAPNPISGEVTGVLTSVDNNNDSLTYRVSVWPAKGSVTWTFVKVEDVVDTTRMFFTYTPTAAARQAAAAPGATSADQSDTFTVTVSDGYGGTVNVEIEVPIGVVVG
jgi:VCBS repeat-containing protein